MSKFVILGAQKAASTFLHRCMHEHPDVHIPWNEVPIFETPDYQSYGEKTINDIFSSPLQHAHAVGIKRPTYLHKAEVPARLHKHVSNAKLIISLRDPVERAISAYYHYMKGGFVPMVDINEGLLKIMSGVWSRRYPRAHEIIQFGRYFGQIDRYLEYFNEQQICITTTKSIKHRPGVVARRVYNLVGVSDSFEPSVLNSKSNRGVYSLSRIRILRMQNPILFKYFYNGQRLTRRKDIGPLGWAAVGAIRAVDWLLSSVPSINGKPNLEEEVSSSLCDYYHSDAIKLQDKFDLDIGHWSVFK